MRKIDFQPNKTTKGKTLYINKKFSAVRGYKNYTYLPT